MLDAAVSAALDEGVSRLTFGRLAKRLGVSDRVIVYYFPTKDDLIGEVLLALGTRLQAALAPTFSVPAVDHVDVVRAAWPMLARTDVDGVFALFFEASGLAAARLEPYSSIVPRMVDGWIEWTAERIEGTPAHRRSEAAAAVAIIDGLLLLRQVSGPAAADRAARALGVSG